jgi:hypothetical protein
MLLSPQLQITLISPLKEDEVMERLKKAIDPKDNQRAFDGIINVDSFLLSQHRTWGRGINVYPDVWGTVTGSPNGTNIQIKMRPQFPSTLVGWMCLALGCLFGFALLAKVLVTGELPTNGVEFLLAFAGIYLTLYFGFRFSCFTCQLDLKKLFEVEELEAAADDTWR